MHNGRIRTGWLSPMCSSPRGDGNADWPWRTPVLLLSETLISKIKLFSWNVLIFPKVLVKFVAHHLADKGRPSTVSWPRAEALLVLPSSKRNVSHGQQAHDSPRHTERAVKEGSSLYFRNSKILYYIWWLWKQVLLVPGCLKLFTKIKIIPGRATQTQDQFHKYLMFRAWPYSLEYLLSWTNLVGMFRF